MGPRVVYTGHAGGKLGAEGTDMRAVEVEATATKVEEGKEKTKVAKGKEFVSGAGTLDTTPTNAGTPGGMEARAMVAVGARATEVATRIGVAATTRTGAGATTRTGEAGVTRTTMGAMVDPREEEGRREARREEDKEGETPSTSWMSKVARSELAYQPSYTMRCR